MVNREKILRYLYDNPSKSATEVAHALGLKPSSVSSEMTRMRQRQPAWVWPTLGVGPRGGITYALTEEGKAWVQSH